MSTIESVQRTKSDKIALIAARGARVATELGSEPDLVQVFLTHYFRHVDPEDVDERSVEDLLGLVESHYRLALTRPNASARVEVGRPRSADDGWAAGGATVVQIVTDDRPFLVDSITMEVLRQGWSIREVFHPQFSVRRDVSGRLQAIVHTSEAATDPTVLGESWMHLEILPPTDRDAPGDSAEQLRDGLLEVLRDVEDAVEDWAKMHSKAEETIAALRSDPPPVPSHQLSSAIELLSWLNDNHFTYLGYREYRYDQQQPALVPVPSTGLGILRADQDVEGAFHALPQPGSKPWLMIITKDNFKSRIHRPTYLDYIGIRTFAADGTVLGEQRFLGLFASSAYSESVPRIPVLRTKAAEVLRRSGYDEASHGGKAIMDVLDTYPRDELFQTTVGELAPIVERVAHLKERRQVRLFVRRDAYGRYVSCLVYLPRDRYTTAVRNKMETILMQSLGGGSVDYTARVNESVLARLHFVVRIPAGESVGDIDVHEDRKSVV